MSGGLGFLPVESRRGFEFCDEVFGIGADAFAGLGLYQRGKSTLWVACTDLMLDGLRPVDGVGIPFLRIDRAAWKLTAVAAVQFGGLATRNVVEVDAVETARLMRREPVEFPPGDPRRDLPWKAHVIVRHRGVPIGIALWRGEGLDSSVPKGRTVEAIDLPA